MRATLRRGIGLPMAVLALGLYGAGVSPPALAQQAPDPPTAAVGSQSDAVPGTADSNATSAQAPAAGSTPPSSTEGDNGPTMNRSDSAPAAVGLEELDDILTEEPADPATASAAQGEGAPAKTDSATPPSSAEGATAPTTSSTKRAPVTVGLEEIVVTATKREQSSREIPATVNVLSGEELEAIGARELEDYLKLVPGIVMQEGDTNNNRAIAIRGISPQPNAGTTTVGMLINDVSMSDPVSSFLVPDLDPFDLYTVEVLKGPQGTLFGASALNGAVRYVLNKPVLGVTEGKGFANGLTISEGGAGLTWGAALNVPVTDTVALRAAGVWQQRPGLYDDVNANGKNEKDADKGDVKTGRLLGLWQPTDALSINAFYLKQHNFRNNASFANNFDGELVRTDTPGPSTATQEFEVANLDLRYDFDWFTLVSETSRAKKLSDANFDGSFVAEAAATRGVYSLRERISADTDAITQELRLVSPPSDSPWAWLAGAYLGRYDARFTFNESVANTEILGQLLTTLGLPLPDPLNLTVTPEGLSVLYLRVDPLEAKEEALFGELTRKFFDNRLEFGLGGRFYQQQLTTQGVEGGVLGPATIVLGVLGTVRGTDGGFPPKERGFSPKGSVKFQWTRDLLLYGAIARGFQYGGRNGQALIPTDNVYPLTYKSSSVWSYEAGVRTDWLDKTLQLDLTGFYIDWTDIQILQKTASGNTDYTSNAGKARSVGVEGAVRWVTPIPGLSLSNVASYIRATIQETYTTAEGFVIAKGDDLASAPHLQTATTLGYKLPLGSFSAGAGLTYAHIGEAFNNITHDFTIFDYGTLDASITLGAPQWQFAPELTFSGTNLTDERVLTGGRISGNNNPALQGALEINRVTYNRPRAFAARLSFRF